MSVPIDHLAQGDFGGPWATACQFVIAVDALEATENADPISGSKSHAVPVAQRPDMQVPLWNVSQREVFPIHAFRRIAVFVAAGLSISISRTESVTIPIFWYIFFILPGLMVMIITHNSNAIEGLACLVRLLAATTEFAEHTNMLAIVYGTFWAIEATQLCLLCHNFDYCSPLMKALVALLLSLVIAGKSDDADFMAYLMICSDVMNASAKIGWLMCTMQRSTWKDCINGNIWVGLWVVYFAAVLTYLSVAVIILRGLSQSSPVLFLEAVALILLLLTAMFDKIRDLSDSFQLFHIKAFYSSEAVLQRQGAYQTVSSQLHKVTAEDGEGMFNRRFPS
jgi:hypothetical protein